MTKKKTSLKKIVAEIDAAVAQLSDDGEGKEGADRHQAVAKLRKVREDVTSICLPDFEVPSA